MTAIMISRREKPASPGTRRRSSLLASRMAVLDSRIETRSVPLLYGLRTSKTRRFGRTARHLSSTSFSRLFSLLRGQRAHLEQRRHDREHDEEDDGRKSNDDNRFQHGREALGRDVDLFLVGLGDALED